jgi:hypothetical protein
MKMDAAKQLALEKAASAERISLPVVEPMDSDEKEARERERKMRKAQKKRPRAVALEMKPLPPGQEPMDTGKKKALKPAEGGVEKQGGLRCDNLIFVLKMSVYGFKTTTLINIDVISSTTC